MTIGDDTLWTAVVAILTAILTGIGAAVKVVFNHIKLQESRITTLERDMISREDYNTEINQVYRKIDTGFDHLNERLDKMYALLVGSRDK